MQKRDFAIFTIVRNEPFYLPIWCDYYAKNFGEEALYVLDNSSSDSSVIDAKRRWPGINVKSVPSEEALLYAWTTEVAKSFQRSALNAHRVVIFADADEYLIPSSRYANLRQYCDAFLASPQQYVRAQGWAVIHQIDVEPPLPTHGRLLDRRNAMWRAPLYDKTLVSKIPLNWAKGIHTIYGPDGTKLVNDSVDDSLALFHARDVDMDVLHRRCVDRSKMKVTNFRATHGSTDRTELEAYFRTLVKPWVPDMSWVPGYQAPQPEHVGEPQPVPQHWKTLFVY